MGNQVEERMPHICMDEVLAFMMLLPWVGVAVRWAKLKWRKRT